MHFNFIAAIDYENIMFTVKFSRFTVCHITNIARTNV